MSQVKILIVEDNPDDEALILRALERANVTNQITVTRDGAEALDWLFRENAYEGRDSGIPSVFLLDLKLPKIDGLEVLKRIRDDERMKLLPVIVLTSSDEQEDIFRSYNLGANSYVCKPVDFTLFFKAISQLGLYWLLLNEPPPPTDTGQM